MLDKRRRKKANLLCRLAFLKRCRDEGIIPTSAKVGKNSSSTRINNAANRCSLIILKAMIGDTRKELALLEKILFKEHLSLSYVVKKDDWENIDRITWIGADRHGIEIKEKQKYKFKKLSMTQKPKKFTVTGSLESTVKNLTGEELPKDLVSVLSKGFNFAVAPRRIPVEKIICGVESTLKNVDEKVAEEIRGEVSRILKKSKPPKPNLTKDEIKALKDLRKREDILALPADKGNSTVVMNKDDYMRKMEELLDDKAYVQLNNDPTKDINKKIIKTFKECTMIKEKFPRLIKSDPVPPRIYGLPKIHKEDIPLRPIVNSIGSPTYGIAQYIAKKLKPHLGTTEHHIKDSRDFVEKVKSIKITKEDLLVSFDVKSLFTMVPLEETLQLMKRLLNDEEMKLAELCLKSTYFLFNDKYYKQIEGASMGSPLSPVAAEVYMEEFEKTAIATAEWKPRHWFRYVDDTFVIWPHGKKTLEHFFEHINKIHDNIKFTMEIEEDGVLPFLDVKVEKSGDRLEHSVYRKPTHTDRYLNATSHHHPAQKNTLITTLMTRALRISHPNHLRKEERHLKSALRKNGYTDEVIKRHTTKAKRNVESTKKGIQEDPNGKKVILPYVKGTTEKITKILKKHDIKTVYTTDCKISHMINNPKDNLKLRSPGVYSIPCSCGKEYIGQTGRLVCTRILEHVKTVKNGNIEKSAVAEHFYNTDHAIHFDKVSILAKIENYQERLIREAIEIVKCPENFNKEDGYKLSKLWHPVIKPKEKRRNEIQPINDPDRTHQPGSSKTGTNQSETWKSRLRPRRNTKTGIYTGEPEEHPHSQTKP